MLKSLCASALLLFAAPAFAADAVRLNLPADFDYPEGIAYDAKGKAVYLASSPGGQIVRVDITSGRATPLGTGLAAQVGTVFPGLLGMHVDGKGRLWIAGGRTGKLFVVDQKSGALLRTITTPEAEKGLINDLAFIGDRVYFTDTIRPSLWSVKLDGTETTAEKWIDFTGTALEHGPGANLNGIATSADGKSLIAGQMGKGLLFRIDPARRAVSKIDLGGETVEGVDGVIVSNDLLYIVRQPFAEIVTIRLAADGNSGRVLARNKPANLAWPATAALIDGELWVVNSQFNQRSANTPVKPFWLGRVKASELGK